MFAGLGADDREELRRGDAVSGNELRDMSEAESFSKEVGSCAEAELGARALKSSALGRPTMSLRRATLCHATAYT